MDLYLKVARSGNVSLSVPEGSMISFHNSPYYSHKNRFAVDLYPPNSEFEAYALSPIDGILRSIRRFKSPRSKWFSPPPFEPLMLIESNDDPELFVKILHLNPSVQENDRVYIGDCIGTFLRSGYFHRWTDPHMHIEVRQRTDPIRARGGLPIDLINDSKSLPSSLCQDQEMSGKLSLVTDEYVLLEMDSSVSKFGNFSGLSASIGTVQGILDCGIPHYNLGGLHLPSIIKVGLPAILKINGKTIGQVSKNLENTILFKSLKTRIKIDDIPILGLSLRLHVGISRTIKVIPTDPSTFPFVENDQVTISIRGVDSEN
ncbi:MAG: hypothetical protein JSW01_00670 [Candidatus Bathyarchaeota archaeon]|nr:MAG: hypothetical protein JSW01_00670 [Candidatus Bathyarchaeota archaeon]